MTTISLEYYYRSEPTSGYGFVPNIVVFLLTEGGGKIDKPDPTGNGILNMEGADLTLDLVVANFERTLRSSSLCLVDLTMEGPR